MRSVRGTGDRDMKYRVGQRVIVTPENLCGPINVGYYGHVVRVEEPEFAATKARIRTRNRFKQPLYHVHLDGRTGAEACWWMLSETEGFNPYGFFENEIEAAD